MRYTENAPLNADLCPEWRRHARRCAIARFKELFEVFEKRRDWYCCESTGSYNYESLSRRVLSAPNRKASSGGSAL